MSSYPDCDFPFTLYFQGIEMPKWSNCWHFQPVADSDVDWYVDQVHGRMDHVGCVESEESAIFIIAAQQVLLAALDRKGEFLQDLDYPPAVCEAAYQGVLSGLQQMIAIAEKEEVVFWIGGYPNDQATLIDAVRRYRLGNQHPEYFHPQHRIRRSRERLSHLNSQRKNLRRRLMTIGSNKALKRFIHELKDRVE